MLSTLQWLEANNRYYQDVNIDHSVLARLPIDGKLSTHLPTASIASSNEQDVLPPVLDCDDNPASDHLGSTFVPMPSVRMTEQLVIEQSVLQTTPTVPTVSWPSMSSTAINEFTTEGYMSCTFPTFFPTGAADFLTPRHKSVSIANYFKHMLLYCDGRFAKHPRFRFVVIIMTTFLLSTDIFLCRYFALNTEMRHRALQTGRIYVRQSPHDAHLSVDALKDMVCSSEGFCNRVLHFGASLRGTRQFCLK